MRYLALALDFDGVIAQDGRPSAEALAAIERLRLSGRRIILITMFSQIAEGIDEESWMFHLRRGDYSRWFRASVKDNYLADQTERIERRPDLRNAETRELICRLIDARYTLPE